jgi:hypothetical protein
MRKGLVVLTLALLLFVPTVYADEVLFLGLTRHGSSQFKDTDGQYKVYNSLNPGIVYTFDNGIGVGTFKNSYYKQSLAVSYRSMMTDNLGVMGGYATGYEGRNSHGLIGGFVVRTRASDSGWRAVLIAQPFGGDSSAFSFALSKDLK